MKMMDYKIKSELDVIWSAENFSRKLYDMIDNQIDNIYGKIMSFLSFGGKNDYTKHNEKNMNKKKQFPLDAIKLVYNKSGGSNGKSGRRSLNNIIGLDIHLVYNFKNI